MNRIRSTASLTRLKRYAAAHGLALTRIHFNGLAPQAHAHAGAVYDEEGNCILLMTASTRRIALRRIARELIGWCSGKEATNGVLR